MVSYDTVQMAVQKTDYIRKNGLGGAMWWESSADKKGGESIIGNVSDALRQQHPKGHHNHHHNHESTSSSATDHGLSSLKKVAKNMLGYDGGKAEFVENNLAYPDSKFENLRKGMPGE